MVDKEKVVVESGYDNVDKLKTHPTLTAVANAIAAGITNFLIQPIAVLRTQLQSLNVYDHGINKKNNYKLISLLKLFKKDGILSCYRGSSSSIFVSSLGWLTFRYFYDAIGQFNYFKNTDDVKNNMIRATISSLLSSIILHPFWNAKLAIELQSGQTKIDGWPQYRGTIHYLIHTFKTGGIRSNFIGISVSLSSTPNHAILITLYDSLSKINWNDYKLLSPYQSLQPFTNGVISRLVPTFITYPLYVSRTMQQCCQTEISHLPIRSIIKWNAKNNSIKGLYAGFQLQVFRSMISGGIMFSIYEFILVNIARAFKIYNNNH